MGLPASMHPLPLRFVVFSSLPFCLKNRDSSLYQTPESMIALYVDNTGIKIKILIKRHISKEEK